MAAGHVIALRPPLESSDFQVTAASIRSLKAYGPKSQRPEYDKAVERAVHWLETAQAGSTEDLAFKILGLIWGGGSQAAIRADRAGNCWHYKGLTEVGARFKTLAYRCVCDRPGSCRAAGGARALRSIRPAYRRGIQYLLNSQLEDGSWHVGRGRRRSSLTLTATFPTGPISSFPPRRATGLRWR